jgi:hypothetical protein
MVADCARGSAEEGNSVGPATTSRRPPAEPSWLLRPEWLDKRTKGEYHSLRDVSGSFSVDSAL